MVAQHAVTRLPSTVLICVPLLPHPDGGGDALGTASRAGAGRWPPLWGPEYLRGSAPTPLASLAWSS